MIEIPRFFKPVIGLSLALMVLTGCTSSPHDIAPSPPPTTASATIPAVPTISPLEAYDLIQKNWGNASFILLDVRTPDEFNSGHIANAINLDYYSPDFKSLVGKLDRSNQYLVYCRTGIRGAFATRIMLDLGFKEALNLSGGITRWVREGYPVVE